MYYTPTCGYSCVTDVLYNVIRYACVLSECVVCLIFDGELTVGHHSNDSHGGSARSKQTSKRRNWRLPQFPKESLFMSIRENYFQNYIFSPGSVNLTIIF